MFQSSRLHSVLLALLRATLAALWLVGSGFAAYWIAPRAYEEQYDARYADLLLDTGHWDEAKRLLEARLRAEPGENQTILMLARCMAGSGDTARCAELLAEVPDSSPLKPDALLREGQARLQIGDAVAADSGFNICVQRAFPTSST
jgi:thioredoxin-like negative regulator of GroEL